MYSLFDYGYTLSDMREDRAAESYNVAYAIEDEKRRIEHEAEFDFPYVSNGDAIERAIKQKAKAAKEWA